MTSAVLLAQQATPHFKNASSGFASFGDSTGVAAVAIVIALAVIGLMASTRFYRWALSASGRFAASLEYAIKGILTAGVIAVFAAPVYLLATIDAPTRRTVGVAAIGLSLAYIVLVALGIVGEAAWRRVVDQHEAATGNHPLDRFRSDEEVAD